MADDTVRERALAHFRVKHPMMAESADRGDGNDRIDRELFVHGYMAAQDECEHAVKAAHRDALDQALAELRAERHKTETWKEKERAALSKAIARIEKLKATKGTDVEK